MQEDTQKKEDLTAEDLDLIDPALEDAGKTEEEIWNEFEPGDEPTDTDASKPADDVLDDEEGKTEEKPAEASKPEDAPDIWANASPEQRAAFEEAQKRATDFEHRLRSDDGRVSSLQRKINRLQEDLKNRPSDTGKQRNETATEALGRLKSEYPEIAEMLDPVLENVRGDVTDLSNAEKKRLETTQRDLQESQTELAGIANANARAVETAHPGYKEFLAENSDAFLAWVEDQPRAIREAAYANAQYVANPAAAIEVINRFKATIQPPADQGKQTGKEPDPGPEGETQTQQPNDRRRRQLDASASPSRSARRPATSGVPEDGDPQAIWDAFEAQEEARRA